MTDADLLAKKLAGIEPCVQELRTLARPAEIVPDVREEHDMRDIGEPPAFPAAAK